MLIICPSCATAYNVEGANLGPDGRQVRCVRCRAVWQAEADHAGKLLAAAGALAPVQAEAPGLAAKARQTPAAGSGGASVDGPPPGERPMDGQLAERIEGSDPALAGSEDPPSIDQPGQAAEFEAPPIAPVDLDETRAPIEIDADRRAEREQDIETVAARRQRRSAKRRPPHWPLSALNSAILGLLVVAGVLLGWRSGVVRVLPQTASLYATIGLPVNVRGLVFDGVTTTVEQHEGVPILVVEGNIVNETRKPVEVPRIKVVVRNAGRQEIYSWTAVPTRTSLPPGEAVSFHTRLASPPTEARDVLVRFVNRRDLIGAVR